MAKRIKKTYSPEERRRKNRRFNRILYIVAALLILTGVIIIVSDQTYFFDDVGKWLHYTFTDDEAPVMPTIPPFSAVTLDPNATPRPGRNPNERDPYSDDPTNPYNTSSPDNNGGGGGGGGSYTPSTPVPYNPYAPVCVYFVGHDIICPVDPVGYNRNGEMDVVRSAYRAGWFYFGGNPVEGGNVLIAGHNRYSGKLGYFAVVKDKLKTGDTVIIEMANGEYAYYRVDSIESYMYDAVPEEIMTTGGEPRLTLITCQGDFSSALGTSRHRVIAVCSPVYYITGAE